MTLNYRKIIVSALVAVMTLIATTCFAKISISDVNIDGISYKQEWSDVIAKYGQPIRQEPNPPKGYLDVFQYGDSTFRVLKSRKETVVKMIIDEGCPLSTKAGIKIGSTLSDIKSAYGEPDRVETHDAYKYIIITYLADNQENITECQLSFQLDRNSEIVKVLGFEIYIPPMP